MSLYDKEVIKMSYHEKFTEEEVIELLEEDVSLAQSISSLINDRGDICAFLKTKLLERREKSPEFLQMQEEMVREMIDDWNALQDAVDATEARYINEHCFS